MLDDRQLLRRYVADGYEAAFAELVAHYVNLVYSVALRRTNGDTHLAQDVAQLAFTDLARKARSLPENVVLAGWLHRATRYAAAQLLRTEHRRAAREQEAVTMNSILSETDSDPARRSPTDADWAQIRPLLDEALDELGDDDRDALVLRFFEQRSLAEVGQALGANEDTARKRVTRALEKLRADLVRRGITTTAATLSAAISVNAVQAAPVGLAATLSTTAIAGTTLTATVATATKTIAMTTLQKTLIAAVVAACVAGSLLIQRQSKARLDEQDNRLQQQAEQLVQLVADDERLSSLTTNGSNSAENRLEELEKLRTEAKLLRRQTNDLVALQLEDNQPHPPTVIDAKTPMQFRELDRAKVKCIEAWSRAFIAYAREHQGQLPTSFAQAKSLWRKEIEENKGGIIGSGMTAPEFEKRYGAMTEQFEIVYQGSLDGITNPNGAIVFREKQPWPHITGKWGKCFVVFSREDLNQDFDPHLHYCSSTDKTANGNWDSFEKTHTAAPQ